MSSKGRSASGYTPDPSGFFATQPQTTRALLPYLGIAPGMRILEPSCGKGAIAKVLREAYGKSIEIVGVEIDKRRAAAARKLKASWVESSVHAEFEEEVDVFNDVIVGDFFAQVPRGAGAPYDRVVTNPSFSIWLPFAEHCWKFGQHTTLLLPFNAAASKGRSQWWRDHPAHLRVLSKRPSFAISVKCTMASKKNKAVCSFQELVALDAKPKKTCPLCGEATETTRSDSSEYAWVTWAPDVTRGLWDTIDTPEAE